MRIPIYQEEDLIPEEVKTTLEYKTFLKTTYKQIKAESKLNAFDVSMIEGTPDPEKEMPILL